MNFPQRKVLEYKPGVNIKLNAMFLSDDGLPPYILNNSSRTMVKLILHSPWFLNGKTATCLDIVIHFYRIVRELLR